MPIATGVQETYLWMREKLKDVVPDFELKQKAELVFEINRLKAERGAVILGSQLHGASAVSHRP